MRFTIGLILTSLRSWRYCAVVEWDLAKPREIEIGISKASFPLPFLDHGSAAKNLIAHRDNTAG